MSQQLSSRYSGSNSVHTLGQTAVLKDQRIQEYAHIAAFAAPEEEVRMAILNRDIAILQYRYATLQVQMEYPNEDTRADLPVLSVALEGLIDELYWELWDLEDSYLPTTWGGDWASSKL
ncbi:hypothetical protein MKZ38_000507 [Zalerion maritima]|uniref:Uncharacterized protein n=1 Tax=Zalerion maritima TaxID=339359 RepID=A0AAD5RSJ7_9PEZI|nr:hypothetical protein MKZ38_000507 [Zalerion maritima]